MIYVGEVCVKDVGSGFRSVGFGRWDWGLGLGEVFWGWVDFERVVFGPWSLEKF